MTLSCGMSDGALTAPGVARLMFPFSVSLNYSCRSTQRSEATETGTEASANRHRVVGADERRHLRGETRALRRPEGGAIVPPESRT